VVLPLVEHPIAAAAMTQAVTAAYAATNAPG
jgi:hypothetical protein